MQKLFAENQFYFMNKTYGQYLKDFKLSDYDFSFEKKIISITGIRKRDSVQ